MTTSFLSQISSYLPHIKLPVPHLLAPKRSLNVYLDTEMGIPLNLREPKSLPCFMSRLNNYEVIFDVGAHIGTYTVLATCSEEVKIHSFEPHPSNVERLEENISYNGIKKQVEVVSSAVADSNGEVELSIGGNNAHNIVNEYGNNEVMTVRSTKLDTYCDEQTLYPDFVKVDVEGAGKLVIEGASDVLDKQPDWLVEPHSEEEEREFRNAFESEGYSITQLTDGHLFATAHSSLHVSVSS